MEIGAFCGDECRGTQRLTYFPQVDRYLAFLSAGGSKYPIDILKDAGVDMTTSEPFDKAIEKMNKIMDEVEKLIDK